MKKYLLLLIALVFISCDNDDDNGGGNTDIGYEVWILNQGSWGQDNSSITHVDEDGNIMQDFYSTTNGSILGDSGNGMIKVGDKIYALISGSTLMEVLDANTGNKIKTIDLSNYPWPWKMTHSNGMIYFTDLYSNSISMINTETDALVGEGVATGPNPEDICIHDNKIFVCNTALGQSNDSLDGARMVYVYDQNTMEKTAEINVGPNTRFVYAEGDDLFVGYSNFWDASDIGGVKRFDINSYELEIEWKATIQSTFIKTDDGIVFLDGTGVKIIEGDELKDYFVNPNTSEFWSGLAYNNLEDQLLIMNAKDYQVQGNVLVLEDKQVIDTIDAGIIPYAAVIID